MDYPLESGLYEKMFVAEQDEQLQNQELIRFLYHMCINNRLTLFKNRLKEMQAPSVSWREWAGFSPHSPIKKKRKKKNTRRKRRTGRMRTGTRRKRRTRRMRTGTRRKRRTSRMRTGTRRV